MKITVLFFGATADLAGQRVVELDLPVATTTASDVIGTITNAKVKLANHKLLVAVNQEYVSINSQLKDGDELAIFTAVS
ncbi:MAG: MoaD/ThiS family protein, partial [Pyrinomonadaceae bacterium]